MGDEIMDNGDMSIGWVEISVASACIILRTTFMIRLREVRSVVFSSQ